jgi:hypothetical protein
MTIAADKVDATPTSGDHAAHHNALANAVNAHDVAIADLQPLDADLTAIAALTTTAYGRALLTLADATAGRASLGLGTAATQAIGAFDAAGAAASAQAASQPVDSDLTAIAALTTTVFGRALLALADAAAGRTAMGLGSVDNTPDTAKPVSVAQQAALDADRTRLTTLESNGIIVIRPALVRNGVTDNKTVIDAAITAAGTAGIVYLGGAAGIVATSGGHVHGPGVSIEGDGIGATVLKHTGNNVCFTYTEGASPDGAKAGGGGGFTLLGNSGASAVGLKIVDCYGSKWSDIVIGSRSGADQYSNGVGVLMRTETFWTEGTVLSRVGSLFNKVGVRFERTASAGGQTAVQNSFAYTTLRDCWINVPDAGTGIDFGGPADNYILAYMGLLDVHIWLGVAGAPVNNAIGVLVRLNAEIPPNTTSQLRIEPKGSGTGNFTVSNLGGRFNPRNGLQRWNDASASENRVGGTSLMHGAQPTLSVDPSAASPAIVGFNDLWAAAHAGFGVTAKANQEAPFTFGYSGLAGIPIHRFAGMGGAVDPTAPFDVDTNTKAWIDSAGAYCIGTLADFRKISRGSVAPEGSVTGTRGDLYIRTLSTGASLYTKAQGDATNTGWTCISALKNSTTWDPPSTLTGAVSAVKTVTVTGAVVGDFALASLSAALPAGVHLTAEVTAADTVSVYLVNLSGSTQDVASGTLSVRVHKN